MATLKFKKNISYDWNGKIIGIGLRKKKGSVGDMVCYMKEKAFLVG